MISIVYLWGDIMNSFIVKGDFCFSKSKSEIITKENAYLLVENGMCKGFFDTLEKKNENYTLFDYTGHLIFPGMIDLHTHAPQYAFSGTGMDLQLLEWLDECAFPEEAKYSDLSYAKKAYSIFCDTIKHSVTTRACVFATIHSDTTHLLMDMLDKTGLFCYVGKVNMDRNSPSLLCEKSAEISVEETENFIENTSHKYKNIKPIITPRFIPTCSDELSFKLGEIAKKHSAPIQSHLCENKDEIEWVKELCKEAKNYADAYDRFSLLTDRTIMAHCVHLSSDEIKLLKERNTFVAHCPTSNSNLKSGIAKIREYIEHGLNIGLGSDVAGGETLSLFSVIKEAIKMSKMYSFYADNSKSPLTFSEAFYLATKGGGKFFSNVGSFEEGYEFDAVVLNFTPYAYDLSVKERMERAVYTNEDLKGICAKFVNGNKIV